MFIEGTRVDSRIEDFTNWSVTDPNSDFTITPTSIVVTTQAGAGNLAWMVYDLGTDPSNWIGDYRAEFNFTPAAGDVNLAGTLILFQLSNDDYTTRYSYIDMASNGRMDLLRITKTVGNTYSFGFRNGWDGAVMSGIRTASFNLTVGTTYYLRMSRVGREVWVDIWTVSIGGTRFDTLRCTSACQTGMVATSKQERFRYISTVCSANAAGYGNSSGTIANLNIWKNNSRLNLGMIQNIGCANRLSNHSIGRKMKSVGPGLSHIK